MREEFAATAPVVAPAITPAPAGSRAAAVTPATGDRRGGGSMRFLTQVIVDLGFAPRERVEAAMLAARDAGTTPDQLLVDQGVITAEQRARAIAERLGLDFLDLTQYRLDMAAVNLLPAGRGPALRARPGRARGRGHARGRHGRPGQRRRHRRRRDPDRDERPGGGGHARGHPRRHRQHDPARQRGHRGRRGGLSRAKSRCSTSTTPPPRPRSSSWSTRCSPRR